MSGQALAHSIAPAPHAPPEIAVALVGNPNAGKTTLFNALTGLRAKTSNFPGTTIEHRLGRIRVGGSDVRLIDLPGLYSVHATTMEETVARRALLGEISGIPTPRGIILLLDATNLERNLYLASQVLELGLPTVVALNMIDLARRDGIAIDVDALASELGCPVVPLSARNGEGVPRLREALGRLLAPAEPDPPAFAANFGGCERCPFAARYDWAEQVGRRCMNGRSRPNDQRTDRIDAVLTHPVIGTLAFLGVMVAVFTLIFWLARFPMDWIESGFASADSLIGGLMPPGDLRSLLLEGALGGVGGVLVFLPQICILFFFLSLLEDTGYLARAAFVMDRLMKRVGLPGKAFVPMLSAHACAVPAIMSTRAIESRRDRLVTILVLPLLTCSARIPVYAMITALLFPHRPLVAAAVFTGAYLLGVLAALGMAGLFKRTILRGESRPLAIELPSYKIPSLRNALLTVFDRGWIFVRKAGTVILLFSVALWALANYPRSEMSAEAQALIGQAGQLRASGSSAEADSLVAQARSIEQQQRLSHSAAGRLGRAIEPVLRPLGFDWQIGVGIVSSFAAREVIVSTLAIVYGVGDEDGATSLQATLGAARRPDGTRVFTLATCLSLLTFYVLAMQCIPTQVIARRETGGWRWPLFQFGYMTALAYAASLTVYQVVSRLV